MESDNLIYEINCKTTTLIKDSNSGPAYQKHLLRVLQRAMCASRVSDVIAFF